MVLLLPDADARFLPGGFWGNVPDTVKFKQSMAPDSGLGVQAGEGGTLYAFQPVLAVCSVADVVCHQGPPPQFTSHPPTQSSGHSSLKKYIFASHDRFGFKPTGEQEQQSLQTNVPTPHVSLTWSDK